ncbi:BfmA/BtgA family mobilization protein [Leeuwenhoekiella palythoae]|uniref:BfmA/BtgA family mobilization protein n=1 Tax=Leeuwenhoekiella palythoae TaxID=573501 RepID=UPI003518E3F1
MDKGYEKERFVNLSIKESVARDFRVFSKKLSRSQSMALREMLDFFQVNELSPNERLGPSGRTMEANLKKRINAVIAIIRDIEKTQTKPTNAMLQSLFELEPQKEKPLIVEKKYVQDSKQPRFREKQKED